MIKSECILNTHGSYGSPKLQKKKNEVYRVEAELQINKKKLKIYHVRKGFLYQIFLQFFFFDPSEYADCIPCRGLKLPTLQKQQQKNEFLSITLYCT